MKKKIIVALALCLVACLALTGCQAGLLSSNVTVYADGSGVKTIEILVYGDDSPLAGQEEVDGAGLVGNNSKYLLVTGDELVNKIKSYSGLEDLDVKVAEQENGNTLITLSYSFTDMEDYYQKTCALAKDNAQLIEKATFTDNGDGTFTFKEKTENTHNAIDNLALSLYNDPEAFSKDGQGECDLEANGYDYTCIYTILSESATVGDQTTVVNVNKYDESNALVSQNPSDYVEVTGTPEAKAAPAASDNTALIIGVVVAVVIVAGVVVILLRKKKTAK